MVEVTETRSTLKKYKIAFVALTLFGIVSTIYVTSDVNSLLDVSSSPEDDARMLGSYKVRRAKKRAKAAKVRIRFQAERKRARVAAKKAAELAAIEAYKASKKTLFWAMSPIYGGADEILKGVEYATGESTGTNYGDQVWDKDFNSLSISANTRFVHKKQFRKGPFLSNIDLPAPSSTNVLVKTYCGPWCIPGAHDSRCRLGIEYNYGMENVGDFSDLCATGRRVRLDKNP